jgi:hypothetical protein
LATILIVQTTAEAFQHTAPNDAENRPDSRQPQASAFSKNLSVSADEPVAKRSTPILAPLSAGFKPG